MHNRHAKKRFRKNIRSFFRVLSSELFHLSIRNLWVLEKVWERIQLELQKTMEIVSLLLHKAVIKSMEMLHLKVQQRKMENKAKMHRIEISTFLCGKSLINKTIDNPYFRACYFATWLKWITHKFSMNWIGWWLMNPFVPRSSKQWKFLDKYTARRHLYIHSNDIGHVGF